MFTIEGGTNQGLIVPVGVYKNRENIICDQKRYHLLYIESGSGKMNLNDRKELFLGPTLYCFNEEEMPQIEFAPNTQFCSIYIDPNYINNRFTFDNLRNGSEQFEPTDWRDRSWFQVFFERTDNFYGKINIPIASAKRLSKLFELLNQQLEEQPDVYWPCRGRSYLIEILFLVEQSRFTGEPQNSLFASGYSEEIDNIILYFYNNYNRKITIPELVKEFCIDRTTLSKKFMEEVGDSAINCLIKIRISMASDLLKDTLIPISEIMYRVGFTDISHFNRTFKKHMLCTPSEYRSKYNIVND